MLTTIILTVILWILFFLAELAAAAFYPHPFIIEYFPNDVKEKARDHKPPFKAAPVIGRILIILIFGGFIGTFIYAGWDGVHKGYSYVQFL